MSNDLTTTTATELAPLTAGQVKAQVQLIQSVMKEVMQKDEHYGVIPGTNKPTLLKAGAEKLCMTFRLDPQYEIVERYDGDHLTITSRCLLYHIPTGRRYGSGMGSCSTRESKYAYRISARTCPTCGYAAIIKGKQEYGGGWVCFKKKDGCGAKFADGDAAIEAQAHGRTANEDLPDQYNTVLKMANKRSLVAATLNATAASDIFTQDMEDAPEPEAAPVVETPVAVVAPPPPQRKQLVAAVPAPPANGEALLTDWLAVLKGATTLAELDKEWARLTVAGGWFYKLPNEAKMKLSMARDSRKVQLQADNAPAHV